VKEQPPARFIVFAQNHDQVGNRMQGDRLALTLPLDKLKLAAGAVLLSPYIPLLFMGEEYGETAPFPYFTSHGDPELVEAVRRGRREEFAPFAWQGDPPDPQAEATFLSARIDPALREREEHAVIFRFYKRLLELRRTVPALGNLERKNIEVSCFEQEKALAVRRISGTGEAFCIFGFSEGEQEVATPLQEGIWEKVLDSSALEWGGAGEVAPPALDAAGAGSRIRVGPFSVVVYLRND
jgi:maltooligosyltrehalose trehalohydrolase